MARRGRPARGFRRNGALGEVALPCAQRLAAVGPVSPKPPLRVRFEDEDAFHYLLRGVSLTSRSAIRLVKDLRTLMLRTKHDLRERLPKLYSQDLLNDLFRHPYTKIEYIERDLAVSRITAAKYLDRLGQAGFVRKQKIGKSNYYINEALFALLTVVTLDELPGF